MKTNMKVTSTISAVVIRADGTRENLGVVSQEKFSLTKKLLQKLKGKNNGNSTNHSR
jgi:hypothetical protein